MIVPEGWRATTLGELCAAGGGSIQTGPFGSQLHASDYVQVGIPSVMPQNIGDNVIYEGDIARISEEDADRLAKYLLRENDIVYSRRGDVEKRALVRHENDGWLCGTGCLRVRFGDEADCDPRFVSYFLGTESSRKWITLHAVGATMPNLNTAILSAFPVAVPPLAQQNAIADVLGALDDKIAVNRKLAEAAAALLAAQFAALELDVDHGDQIPLSVYFELNPKCSKPVGEEPTYLDMQKLPTSEILVADWEQRPAKSGTRFMNRDTLLARITPCLENGKAAYVDFLQDGEVALGSTEYIVLRARGDIPSELGFFLVTSPRFRTMAMQHMVGTSGRQRLSAADVAGFTVRNVDPSVLRQWGAVASPLVAHLGALRDENRTLAAMRDTLLPKLMTGEIRVRDGVSEG